MDSAERDSPALSRVDYKVVTCCRCGYAQRGSVLAKGAGCLGHWLVGIQNSRARGRPRPRSGKRPTALDQHYDEGRFPGRRRESDMADDDFVLNVVLRQQAS